MKKRIETILLASLLLLASCAKDNEPSFEQPTDLQKIRFEMIYATATASGIQTRVDGLNAKWTDGDKVGVYIVKGSAGLKASGNWVDNMEMTYNKNGWTYTLPTGKEYFPQDDDVLSFYAYYPYVSNLADPLNMTFKVETDQSTAANLSKSFLMWASTPNVNRNSSPIQLVFKQKLSLLKVSVANGDETWEKAPGPADIVIMKRRYPKTSINLKTGEITDVFSESDRTDIKMYYNEGDGCWYGLVTPNQRINNGTQLLDLVWDNLTTLKHAHNGNSYAFTSGEIKPLDITIRVTPDPNNVYKVADFYPHRGFPIGMVFQISNGGKNGKIVSLNEAKYAWFVNRYPNDATMDLYNGFINMRAVYVTDNNSFANHPAFAWVDGLNGAGTTDYATTTTGVWYMPAKEELKALYAGFCGKSTANWDDRQRMPGYDEPEAEAARTTFNALLQSVGGDIFETDTDPYYWSSSGIDSDWAWFIYFSSGYTYNGLKQAEARVRAVQAF